MRVRRDIIVQSILKHQKSFFKILDYINKNAGVLEIPVTLYLKLYNKEILTEARIQSDINTHNHLSIESLVENGVFVYHNKNTGHLMLDSIIFDLLRFIDVSRARELNREDFENLRGHVELTVSNVLKHPVGTVEYDDAMQTFYSIMNETLSKIRSNVEKLVAKVEVIAQEYKAFEDNRQVSFIELYEKVQFLYRRYVLPCYEFISPSIQLISKWSFSQSLDELISYHHEQGAESVANMVGYNKTAITSYFKDISELENKLKQYSSGLESDRNFFISVENAYSALMNDIQSLRHGKQKGFLLSTDSQFFSHFKSLDGLSTHRAKFNAGLKWKKDKSIQRLKAFLTSLDDIKIKTKVDGPIKPLPDEVEPEEERKILIAEFVNRLELIESQQDLHVYLYESLSEAFSDFTLIDLLFGIECIHDLYDEEIVNKSFEQFRLEDDEYYITYLPIAIQETYNV